MNRAATSLATTTPRSGWPRWLLLRRVSQLGLIGLFLLGPLAGVWIVKGTLSSSLTLDVLPLTDPVLLLQTLVTGHWPAATALIGAAIVLAFYLLVGGRAYCSWVCPMNLVSDFAAWLRKAMRLPAGAAPARTIRYWVLGAVLLVAGVTGTLAWELVNPVTVLHRALVFGFGLGWLVVAAVFLFDLAITARGWCGHVCPMGAAYALIGRGSLLRVSAARRGLCDDCGDCYAICPEPQVIRPALKAEQGAGPVIRASECTNCGRCIDVCHLDVFRYSMRFNQRSES